MTRLKKMIPWMLTNVALFGSLYAGHFQGLPGFMSVFWFQVWALTAFAFIVWCSPQLIEAVKRSPARIPLWLVISLDSIILFFIVWNHNIVTGAFWLTHMLIIINIHNKIREAKDGEE